MLEKKLQPLTSPVLQTGEVTFEAQTFNSPYIAPSNGLLDYRITNITTANGQVIDTTKLNGKFHNHYQLVLGQHMISVSDFRGSGRLIEENGTFYLKSNSIEKKEDGKWVSFG